MAGLIFTTQKQKQRLYKTRPRKRIELKDLQKLSERLKAKGKTIVFTTGSFDLLNPGHCRYLAEAKSLGDVLVVGVAADESDRKQRGEGYPLINQGIRAELVGFLRTVDYAINVDEYHAHGVLALLKPDIFYTNHNAWEEGLRDKQEAYLVKSYGGKIVIRESDSAYYFGIRKLVDHVANIRVIKIIEDYLKDKIDGFALDPEKHLLPADYGAQVPKYGGAFDSKKVIVEFEKLSKLRDKYKKAKKSVAFVSGSYDLLHVGHARFIEQAGMLADILVVGTPSDKSLRRVKGVGRPVICESSRAYILGHLDNVNHVVVFDDITVRGALELLKPDIFFTVEEEWNNYKESVEYKIVTGYGGEVVSSPRQAPFISASALIDKMALGKVREIFKDCMDEQRYERILSEQAR